MLAYLVILDPDVIDICAICAYSGVNGQDGGGWSCQLSLLHSPGRKAIFVACSTVQHPFLPLSQSMFDDAMLLMRSGPVQNDHDRCKCRLVGLMAHGGVEYADPPNFATFDDLQMLSIAPDRVQVCFGVLQRIVMPCSFCTKLRCFSGKNADKVFL